MEKLGDSIMNELETAEDEVCNAWGEFPPPPLCNLFVESLVVHWSCSFNIHSLIYSFQTHTTENRLIFSPPPSHLRLAKNGKKWKFNRSSLRRSTS